MSWLPRPRLRGGCFEDPGREAGVSSLEWLGAALVAGVKTFKGGSGQIRAQEFAGKNSATVTNVGAVETSGSVFEPFELTVA